MKELPGDPNNERLHAIVVDFLYNDLEERDIFRELWKEQMVLFYNNNLREVDILGKSEDARRNPYHVNIEVKTTTNPRRCAVDQRKDFYRSLQSNGLLFLASYDGASEIISIGYQRPKLEGVEPVDPMLIGLGRLPDEVELPWEKVQEIDESGELMTQDQLYDKLLRDHAVA